MNIVTTTALAIYGAIALALLAYGAGRTAWRSLGRSRMKFGFFLAAAVAATIFAQKPSPSGPTITVDAFLRDAGCYATNDVFHVAVSNAPNYAALDFSECAVLVYARVRASTDAADWSELAPRRTFGELPADYAIVNATNHNYMVYLDYVPPSPVHTNGVFELHGFMVPGDDPGNLEQLAAGFINSKVIPPPYDAEVEYLESFGAQYLSIPINVYTNYTVVFDGYISSHNKELYSIAAQANNQFNYETIKGYYRWFSTARVYPSGNYFGVRQTWTCSETLYRNGDYEGMTAINQPSLPTRPLYIFFGSHNIAAGRIWMVQVLDENGRPVFDGRPVRKNGIGYLYDRVSGQLFGNAGTGAFGIGADK